MSAALRHRGPDSAGEVVAGPVALAARRLAIIDLEHGDQPIATEDDAVTVVQNGEIYNHRELAAQLRGHAFRTRCDTEVIGHLYEEHGLRAFERLRGMFAIALWDARERRLVLARDRFGIKPLFHARLRDGSLAFASALLALAPRPRPPPAAPAAGPRPRLPRRSRSRRVGGLSGVQLDPRAAHRLRRRPQAPARPLADLGRRHRR